MRPQKTTVVGDGATTTRSNPIRMNYRQNAFRMGIEVSATAGAPFARIEYTLNDPADFIDSTDYTTNAFWVTLINDDTDTAGNIVLDSAGPVFSGVTNIIIPIQSVRGVVAGTDIQVGALAGTANFTFLQGNAW